MELSKLISSILFYYAEPLTVQKLSSLLKHNDEEVRLALEQLAIQLPEVGLVLLQNGNEVTLGTAPESSSLIENITKEELSKDLSKAALETLAIVLYKGPITRSEIDYIRGVNSTFILRNLLIRGLIEKIDNPKDLRSFLYKSTLQLFEYMGVSRIEDLPDYQESMSQLSVFLSAKQETEPAAELPASIDTEVIESTPALIDDTDSMNISDQELEEQSDILEEDEMGEGFFDEQVRERTEIDRAQETS